MSFISKYISILSTGSVTLMLVMLLGSCGERPGPIETHQKTMERPTTQSSKFLIDVVEFKRMMDENEMFKLIQISKEAAYKVEHLPGAMRIYREDFQVGNQGYDGLIAPKETIENLLGNLGVKEGEKLVLYDEFGNVNAARFWWVLKRYGYENMVMIDGGVTAWKHAGLMLHDDTPIAFPKTKFRFPNAEDNSQLANIQEVEYAINNPQFMLIDARSKDEYTGTRLKKGATRAGRIPGSILIDYMEALNHEPGKDYTFKSIPELEALFKSKGVTKDKHIIAYCHSGVRSAHTTFVLSELLGYESVQNYDGSWVEWSFYEDLPIETDIQEENLTN